MRWGYAARIGSTQVEVGGAVLRWQAGAAIDADGSPRCYHPGDWGPRSDWTPPGRGPLGLDAPENGGRARRGHSGLWEVYESWGWATHDGSRTGAPVIQGEDDPAPGYYVSTTALADSRYHRGDPRRYVDSERVPYIALPPEIFHLGLGAAQGDLVLLEHRGHKCAAIVADRGPAGHLGEVSIAAAEALGIPGSPRRGGVAGGVTCYLWCGSGSGRPLPVDEIAARVAQLAHDLPR